MCTGQTPIEPNAYASWIAHADCSTTTTLSEKLCCPSVRVSQTLSKWTVEGWENEKFPRPQESLASWQAMLEVGLDSIRLWVLSNTKAGYIHSYIILLANEQVGLTTMHTVFLRLHNQMGSDLHDLNRSQSGDDIYYTVRKIIGAIMQKITYTEWLPTILGSFYFSTKTWNEF